MIDAHAHLTDINPLKEGMNFDEMLKAIKSRGVKEILTISVNFENFLELKELVKDREGIFLGCGVYPDDIDPNNINIYNKLLEYSKEERVIAIGETGLDYLDEDLTKDQIENQKNNFIQHIEVSKALKKPIVIHSRGAKEDTLKLLKEYNISEVGGMLHCFTEDIEMARKLIDMNIYISISGIVTFKNAKDISEMVKELPLDRILCETDAPYLAPTPYRGKQNIPYYVEETYKFVADLKNISVEDLKDQVSKNFHKLFFSK